jgi:hypothetical protein
LKEFRVLVTCAVCGETFDSDYKLAKHTGKSHPTDKRAGWVGEEDSCGCGHTHTTSDT